MLPSLAASLSVSLPEWVWEVADPSRPYRTSVERVGLAIHLAKENVARGTGGPFGSAVFEADSGRLVSVGVNLVTSHANSALHAEVVALMFAQQALGAVTLASPPCPSAHVLATSCAPCAMCLGAVHWSGVTRVLIGASREDAMAIGFDEGPVFPESLTYLERTGITFEHDVERSAARAALAEYVRVRRPLLEG